MRSLMTIFVALLANIAMLVHAVVPHHHHNKVFAAVVSLLNENTQQTFNHVHQQGSHFHFASPKVLVVQSFQETFDELQHASSIESNFNHLFADEILPWQTNVPPLRAPSVRANYVANFITDYIARSKGLRAPPTC